MSTSVVRENIRIFEGCDPTIHLIVILWPEYLNHRVTCPRHWEIYNPSWRLRDIQRWSALIQNTFRSVSALFITWNLWTALNQLWTALKTKIFRAKNQRWSSAASALIFSETELISADVYHVLWISAEKRQNYKTALFSADYIRDLNPGSSFMLELVIQCFFMMTIYHVSKCSNSSKICLPLFNFPWIFCFSDYLQYVSLSTKWHTCYLNLNLASSCRAEIGKNIVCCSIFLYKFLYVSEKFSKKFIWSIKVFWKKNCLM